MDFWDGLNVFAGFSQIDQNSGLGDKDSEAYGATYAIGGLTVGYQESEEDNVGASGTYYENQAYAVSYSINDDLAISYGVHESKSNSGSTGKYLKLNLSKYHIVLEERQLKLQSQKLTIKTMLLELIKKVER